MMKNKFLAEIKGIREEIDRINILNNGLNGLEQITDKALIKKYSAQAMKIMINSYSKIGGFKTYKDSKALGKNCKLLYGYFINNSLTACAIYTDFLGGYKMVGCGTIDGSNENKQHIYEIIKNDIDNIKEWHWAEVSGGVEKIFKECNGNPIPASMAETVMGNRYKIISILEDNFHYTRQIGVNNSDIMTKCLYGFKDNSTCEYILGHIESLTNFSNYEGFKNYANNTIVYEDNNQNNKQNSEEVEIVKNNPMVNRNNKELAYSIIEKTYNMMVNLNIFEVTEKMKMYIDWAMTFSSMVISADENSKYARMYRYVLKNIDKITVLTFGDGKIFDDYTRKPSKI